MTEYGRRNKENETGLQDVGPGCRCGYKQGTQPRSLVTCGRTGGVECICTLTEFGASGAWGATRTSGRM